MKAVTVREPWAALSATGHKRYETRSWATKYRGPIAIHAGKQLDDAFKDEHVAEQLQRCGITPENAQDLPRGAIIAIADLVNVWHIVHHPGTDVDVAKHIPIRAESMSTDKHAPDFGDYFVPTEKEMAFGYWVPGNYAWEYQNVKILPEPIPAKGKQGLWDWEPEQEAFLVSMQSCFVDNEDRAAIAFLASNIVNTQQTTFSDDGITQQAVVKTGITKRENACVPNPVKLIPYRTFLEVQQPQSEFVFRISEGSGRGGPVGAPLFKLVAADGGLWKNQAMDNVKRYLTEQLAEIPDRDHITIIA